MPQVEVGHARLDVRTYHEAVCDEHAWIGERHEHSSDAWLEWVSHARQFHPEFVQEQKYKRTVTYEPVNEPDESETEEANSERETADASR